ARLIERDPIPLQGWWPLLPAGAGIACVIPSTSPESSDAERTSQMQHVNQQGTTRRTMLRAGAAAGAAAALGAAGRFAAGTGRAATAEGRGAGGGLPYPDVADTSHCAPQVAAIFRGVFTAKSEHDAASFMSYFSTANTTYMDAVLGASFSSWEAANGFF